MTGSTLYLCYFGLREPLVQTQVLPYLRELREGGIEVDLITFEPADPSWTGDEAGEWSARLADDGIHWRRLPYHRRPSLPATMYDIAAGAMYARRLVRRQGIRVIHSRGHVAAAMGALAKRGTGARLLFDIRGFMPEEYVDAGIWNKAGLNYRLTKRAEGWLMAAADGFVVLTEKARTLLFGEGEWRPIEVIPCCVDLERFEAARTLDRDAVREDLGVAGRRVLVYLGALGGWYLTDEMAEFLAAAHRQDPTTYSMVLTQSAPEMIREPLRRAGVPETDVLVRAVPPAMVPRYLRAADLGVSFIKRCYSKQSSSPTKLAEYLAAGLPVVCNAGVGDVDSVITTDRIGVLMPDVSPQHFLPALEGADALRREPGIGARCRESAVRHFDLHAVGGTRYRRIYERLLSPERLNA